MLGTRWFSPFADCVRTTVVTTPHRGGHRDSRWEHRPPPVASHGPPRPIPTHHAPWGCPGWPGHARVGRWWPVAASPCRRGSRRWWTGGVRGRHGHHGHPHRRRQNTTTRPSLCVAHSPRGCMWSLSMAHTRGTPIGAHGRSYTPVAHRSSPPGIHQGDAQRLHRHHRRRPEHHHEATSMRPAPLQRCPGIPFHAPHAWGTRGWA